MRVIAVRAGYDGFQYRDPDAREDGKPVVFEMPEPAKGQKPASWFVPVDEDGNPLKPLAKEPKKQGREAIPGQGPARGSQQGAFVDPNLQKSGSDANPIA